jgi:MFS family permease
VDDPRRTLDDSRLRRDDPRLQFWTLYLTRFAEGFGFIALITLLGPYITALEPSATTILGLTIGAGIVIGLFTTGFTLAQTVAVVPIAWAGDRYDKRTILLLTLGTGTVVYALFPFVDTAWSFIGVRVLQGVAVTGTSLMSLSLVGQIADGRSRANAIGKANAARFAASILGTVSAGGIYDVFGFGPVFTIVVALSFAAWLGVFAVLDPDETRVSGFPFSDLALNQRIVTMASFRAQYAVAVTLVRTWVPIYAGVSVSEGGLAVGGLAISVTVAAEKFTNMLCQPVTGRLSDRQGRAAFVFGGGATYGLIAMAIPAAGWIGRATGTAVSLPLLGTVPAAYFPLVGFAALLGIADAFREPASMALFADEGDGEGVASSFGIRELIWRPGSVAAPLLGGWLMTGVGMAWVFYVGGAFALTGAGTFLAILVYHHGPGGLREW